MNVVVAKRDLPHMAGTAFADAEARLPGGPRVREARRRAYARFEQFGLPTRRVEDFKYTDLRALIGAFAPLASPPDANALRIARETLSQRKCESVFTLVVVDGVVVPEFNDLTKAERGVSVRSLYDALSADDALVASLFEGETQDAITAFNMAMAGDGFAIEVAAGASLSQPIEIMHIATRTRGAAVTRSLMSLGANAAATLIETYISAGDAQAYQTFDGMKILVDAGAQLDHLRIVEEAGLAANLSMADVSVGSAATYNLFGMASGGQIGRYQSNIVCAGDGANVSTNGVAMLNGRQHADTTIVLDHAAPHCTSRETFRAVLDDRARAVFQGRIIVRPKAQKTDAKMMTRALLLSDEAEADNKPELEIFADDVTCGHGATTGALDESLLFYLRARGLDEKQAQALLIQAFVGEAIESIGDERLRDSVIGAAERWLEARA